jgi:hypothetical protein
MEKDPLNELFRAKLHDWEATPSDRALAKFQAQLGQTTSRPRWGAYWRVAAALVGVLAGGAAWLLWPAGPAPVAQGQTQPVQPPLAALDSPQKVAPAHKFSEPVQPAGPEKHLLASRQTSGAANRQPLAQPAAPAQADQTLPQPGPVVEAKASVTTTGQTEAPESQPTVVAQPDPVAGADQPVAQPAHTGAQPGRGGQKIQVTIRMGTEAAGREELDEAQEQHQRRRTGMGKLLSKLNGGEPEPPGDQVEIKLLGVSKDSLFKKKDKKNR